MSGSASSINNGHKAALLMLTSALVKGFQIDGWIPAILGAVVIALVTTILRTVVL